MIRIPLLRRLHFLFTHPGFRDAPATVLGRCAVLARHLASRRPLTFPISRGGERVRVPASLRYTSSATFLMRDWCEPELRHLDVLLEPGAVFLDVGANIGLYSLRAATLVGPGGRVVAVEPGASALQSLRENLALNPDLAPRITVIAAALSDRAGSASLYHVAAGHDPQAFSLLADGTADAAETVETQTLDGLVSRLGLGRLDLVKMDVEGAEPMVIDGARRCLETLRPTVVFEMNSTIVGRGGADPGAGSGAGRADAAWQRLAALGYRFFRMRDRRLEPLGAPPSEFCNVVARPPAG